MGTTRRFDHDAASPHRFANLTWEQIKSLAARGFEIGSHGMNHKNLADCPLEETRKEIIESQSLLQEHLATPVRSFAYPYGGPNHINADVLQLIKDAGFELNASAYGGVNYGRIRPDNVLRVPVADVSDPYALRAKVEGFSLAEIRERVLGRLEYGGAPNPPRTSGPTLRGAGTRVT